MKCAQSFECRSALGNVISLAINKGIQQGLETGVEHRKAGRSLAQVEAYDPNVESKYVVAVEEFENVSFSLLEDLEALKDLDTDLYPHSDADPPPEFLKLQPVSSQVIVPIYSELGGSGRSGSVSGEILLSDAIATLHGRPEKRKVVVPSGVVASGSSQDNTLAITDYQIYTLTLTNDVVPVTQPHDDLFDTTCYP
ncbi:hypothetical protein Tco_0280693 [Tanacetum coccineum]